MFTYRFVLFGTQLVTRSHERLRKFGEGFKRFVHHTQHVQRFVSLYCAGVAVYCIVQFAKTQYEHEFRQVAIPMLLFGVCVAVMIIQSWRTQRLLGISWTGILIVLMYSTLQESHQRFLSPHTILLYGCILALAGLTSSRKDTLAMCTTIIVAIIAQTWFFCAHTCSFFAHLVWLHSYTPIDSVSSGLFIVGMTTQSLRQTKKQNEERLHVIRMQLQSSINNSVALQKFHQQSLQSEKYRYIQLHKFASIGRITSGLMHDLVNAIHGSHLVLNRVLERGAEQQDIRYITAGIRHTLSIIESTKFHLMNQESPSWFSPLQEIERAQLMLQHKTFVNGIKITCHYARSMRFYGDRVRFYQAIQNLFSNAIDALSELDCQKERSIHVELVKQPHGYVVSISDNGPGIQTGAESLVFQPFFTTKAHNGGTGIGLSLVKEYIEQSFAGTITFTTSAQGTTFFITLPLERVRERKNMRKRIS